jgi:hypothetical protein
MSGTRQAGEAITDDETEFEVRLVMAPTVLEKRRIWKEDVVSSLPFREVWRRLEQRANGVMIDDERVMVIRVSHCRNVLMSDRNAASRRGTEPGRARIDCSVHVIYPIVPDVNRFYLITK